MLPEDEKEEEIVAFSPTRKMPKLMKEGVYRTGAVNETVLTFFRQFNPELKEVIF